ncbi:MAG: hypothetical protein ACOCZB_04230 [Spirochaetota bacterium]
MTENEELLKIAQLAIQNDPRIANSTTIVPSVHREGPIFRRRTVLHLDGTVNSVFEVDEVERSIRQTLPDTEIENNLVPGSPNAI